MRREQEQERGHKKRKIIMREQERNREKACMSKLKKKGARAAIKSKR